MGATILSMIETAPCNGEPECEPAIFNVARFIGEHWPATESGTLPQDETIEAWARLVQAIDVDDSPAVGQDGSPLFNYQITGDALQALRNPIKLIVALIADDDRFSGIHHWHPTTSTTQAAPEAFEVSGDPGSAVGATTACARWARTSSSGTKRGRCR